MVVAKSDREEHEATEHVPVQCRFCSFQALKTKFGQHEEICERRPKECNFCSQTFKYEQFTDHVIMCGAKTKKCDECQRFIANKDWLNHVPKGECARFKKENEQVEKQRLL